MTLIYDFDGTLTPYKDPQLPILSQAGSIAEFYSILKEQYNLNPEEIIYIDDGFTDRFAFEYVKQRGGKSIFVYDENDSKDKQTLTNLQDLKLIDVDFPKDFNLNGPIFSYITNLNKRI